MKILQPSLSVMLLFVFAVGCRKNDFYSEMEQPAVTEVAAAKATAQDWQTTAKWNVANQEDFSVFYTSLKDENLTADVIDNGLVLVFKKNGNAVSALPVEEGAKSASKYWYHQVTEGNILISVDTYGSKAAPDAASSFKYFIITPKKLSDLQAKGQTIDKLMNLTLEQAASIL